MERNFLLIKKNVLWEKGQRLNKVNLVHVVLTFYAFQIIVSCDGYNWETKKKNVKLTTGRKFVCGQIVMVLMLSESAHNTVTAEQEVCACGMGGGGSSSSTMRTSALVLNSATTNFTTLFLDNS